MNSLKKKSYTIIKQNIINCRFAPGEFLNETQLMEEIGVSRTPIREALSKLELEKFVHIVPKKGIMVTELSLKEINDVYQVRMILEPQIVRHWGENISIEKLEKYPAMLKSYDASMSMDQRNQLDDYLHSTIIESCPNAYFTQWMEHVYCQNRRIRITTGQLDRFMKENNDEHMQVVGALLNSDYETAADLLYKHLERGRGRIFDNLLNWGHPAGH